MTSLENESIERLRLLATIQQAKAEEDNVIGYITISDDGNEDSDIDLDTLRPAERMRIQDHYNQCNGREPNSKSLYSN